MSVKTVTRKGTWLTQGPALPCKSLVRPSYIYSYTTTTSNKRYASTTSSKKEPKQRIVILGSGWAGYRLARSLPPSKVSRVLISPRSHFVFTPLLASTTTGTLEFRSVLEPVRRLGLDEFHQGWATSVDFERKVVRVEASVSDEVAVPPESPGSTTTLSRSDASTVQGSHFEVPYDKLVIAVGCYSQTFGVEGVKEHACFLKEVGDARKIRIKVLQAFEKAGLPTTSDEEKKKLLHFAVVGGGPTGIEFAAELHDLIHEDMTRMYPSLLPHVSISVYDIAPKVLPMFDQKLADYATDLFRRQGISIKTERHLERIRRDGDVLMLKVKGQGMAEGGEEVAAGAVVWSTGLMQNPLVKHLTSIDVDGPGSRLACDPKTGSIITDEQLHVQVQAKDTNGQASTPTQTLPDVYGMGDCIKVQNQSLPATAQVANQQAAYLGKQLTKNITHADETSSNQSTPFRFHDLGVMAYLGNWRAIHQSRADELRGRAAWLLWRTAYLTKSMSLRNKLMIPVHWFVTWVFGRDISRF